MIQGDLFDRKMGIEQATRRNDVNESLISFYRCLLSSTTSNVMNERLTAEKLMGRISVRPFYVRNGISLEQ